MYLALGISGSGYENSVSGIYSGCGSTAGGVNNSSLVISPAEFLSLTAFFICSSPSRVKQFGDDDIPVLLHTCIIMIITVIMTIKNN